MCCVPFGLFHAEDVCTRILFWTRVYAYLLLDAITLMYAQLFLNATAI